MLWSCLLPLQFPVSEFLSLPCYLPMNLSSAPVLLNSSSPSPHTMGTAWGKHYYKLARGFYLPFFSKTVVCPPMGLISSDTILFT